MCKLIAEWLYNNAAAIFISAVASLLISKYYFQKANHDSVLTSIVFPIVKILDSRYYSKKNYAELHGLTSSFAVKFLKKEERNKLLALLSSYRAVCQYEKARADTDCVMSYFAFKLSENGINPRPCPLTDDDGDLLFYDFPPDYNQLCNYVYEEISSYEFIESPTTCAERIQQEFKNYTKLYYTDAEIHFFDDYSITTVIAKSHITQEWKDKFTLADKCKAEFLDLSICEEVKEIIRESSVNVYDSLSGEAETDRQNFIKKVIVWIKELKNSKYSSIYVVFCLIEQSVVLGFLEDITRQITDESKKFWIRLVLGLLSLIILIILIAIVENCARKQIEKDALSQIQGNKASTYKKKDLLIECANTTAYTGLLLCVATWVSLFDETDGIIYYKWFLIVLSLVLGIGVPWFFNRKK